jgi:hypothetical protein
MDLITAIRNALERIKAWATQTYATKSQVDALENEVEQLEVASGVKGDDGFSPIVEMDKAGNTVTLRITDAEGSDVVEILDGKDGKDGYGITMVDEAPALGYTDIFTDHPSYPSFRIPHGKDYVLTEADKAEIVQAVMESIGCPVFGIVDENNHVILSGDLPDGTYTIKYEMEDDSIVHIGNLVIGNIVYYSVTKNLTQCSIDNSTTEVIEGNSYSATITANDGYELSSVSVTMGGSAVSVSGGNINIASVTGNIVITAVAEEIAVAEPTNLFVVGGDGYILNGRCSGNGQNRTDSDGYIVSNYIKVENGDTLYIKNASVSESSNAGSGIKTTNGNTVGLVPKNSADITNYSVSNGITQFTINRADADYIRICFVISPSTALTNSDVTNEGIIITVNEPLS